MRPRHACAINGHYCIRSTLPSRVTSCLTTQGLRDTQPAEISLRLGPTKAKDFETSKVFGPSLVTAYELSSVDNLRMTTKVNGETWFDGRLGNWAFTFAQFIASVKRDEWLDVGDFLGFGRLAFSVAFEINRRIKPGDTLQCEIGGVGKLVNTIARETS